MPPLAACRTETEKKSTSGVVAFILTRRGFADAWQASRALHPRRVGFMIAFIFRYQAYLRVNIRFMFQAEVTRAHSPRTLSTPRMENCRNPSADLMMPNTGSGVCLRRA